MKINEGINLIRVKIVVIINSSMETWSCWNWKCQT